ncbi:ribonuclease P protein component [uncultured Coprobacter sp.]|jgi:ribonuclease P protein component|uniref:ribonuclease P protein component n=1 Tax=uncultured Coprobacter sp. TaxID=1720550 RepID=UPI0025CCC22F|nr:ribonuclease P protein component [uncultured Coprobacter sp.]
MANFKLTQAERLCGKKRIDALFTSGNSFIVYPYRIVYRPVPDTDNVPVSMFVSIPKKRFKRAVKRNLIRRRIKEAYRKNKHILTDTFQNQKITLDMAILYLDKEILDYQTLEKKLKDLLQKLKETVCKETYEKNLPKPNDS